MSFVVKCYFKYLFTRNNNSLGLKGLAIKSSTPNLKASKTVAYSSPREDKAMTSVLVKLSLMNFITSRPDFIGIKISVITKSGFSSGILSIASNLSFEIITSYLL